MRILAVDDDPIILKLLEGALRVEDNYELVCCGSAEEALEEVNKAAAPFDCFLLDIMLPGIDGVELCARLRGTEVYKATPIIMITASKEPNLMERAFGAGATDFVMKPLDGMELGARINTAAMLNASLLRERAAKEQLVQLTARVRHGFGESIGFENTSVTDLAALEDYMAQLPSGCFAMTLIAVDVPGLGDIYEGRGPRAFRSHLSRVAGAVSEGLADHSVQIAYAGSGRFVGAIMGRRRVDLDTIAEEINTQFTQGVDAIVAGGFSASALKVHALSDRRLWSGLSALKVLVDAASEGPAPEPQAAEMPEVMPQPVEHFAMAAE